MTQGKIQAARARINKVSAQAAAGYATYQTVSTTARIVMDKVCHVLTINQDYTYDLWQVAADVAVEGRLRVPGTAPEKEQAHRAGYTRFESESWVPVRVPGVVPLLQARARNYEIIEFRSPRKKDLDALMDYLHKREEEERGDDVEIDFVIEPTTDLLTWGESGWEYRKTRRSRSFNSVFIPAELQSEIEADLRAFTESRERLLRLELPWRRGYLLTGPPGTGKTSLSLAIAGVLKFRIASLSLTDIKSDGELRQAISQLGKNTVLVIEDIDAYSVSHDRDHNTAKDGALSLSGLLNSLDGFETPDGLVVIATTNHVEHLDPALIRSGRLDRIFHLGHIDAPELERLYRWFYEEEVPEPVSANLLDAKLAPAEVTEVFKQHLEDPVAGWASLMFMVEGASLGAEASVPALEVVS